MGTDGSAAWGNFISSMRKAKAANASHLNGDDETLTEVESESLSRDWRLDPDPIEAS